MDSQPSARQFDNLPKLERQHRERLAAVALDPAAKKLLNALDRETSVKWEDLPDKTGGRLERGVQSRSAPHRSELVRGQPNPHQAQRVRGQVACGGVRPGNRGAHRSCRLTVTPDNCSGPSFPHQSNPSPLPSIHRPHCPLTLSKAQVDNVARPDQRSRHLAARLEPGHGGGPNAELHGMVGTVGLMPDCH